MCENCGCGEKSEERTFADRVEEVIKAVRPALQSHGGDIELVEAAEDKTVKVRLQGACAGCPAAQMTLKQGVERVLKEKIPEVKEVVPVN